MRKTVGAVEPAKDTQQDYQTESPTSSGGVKFDSAYSWGDWADSGRSMNCSEMRGRIKNNLSWRFNNNTYGITAR